MCNLYVLLTKWLLYSCTLSDYRAKKKDVISIILKHTAARKSSNGMQHVINIVKLQSRAELLPSSYILCTKIYASVNTYIH